MASPITKISRHTPTEEEVQTEAAEKLMAGAASSQDGLLVFLDIINEMHKAGYLNMMQGILKNRDGVYSHAFDFIKIAGLPVVLKNVVTVMQFISTLDPHKVQRFLNAFSRGIDESMVPDEGKTGVFSMMKSLRDPDVQRTITAGLHLLKGIGEELDKDYKQINKEMNRNKEEMNHEIEP